MQLSQIPQHKWPLFQDYIVDKFDIKIGNYLRVYGPKIEKFARIIADIFERNFKHGSEDTFNIEITMSYLLHDLTNKSFLPDIACKKIAIKTDVIEKARRYFNIQKCIIALGIKPFIVSPFIVKLTEIWESDSFRRHPLATKLLGQFESSLRIKGLVCLNSTRPSYRKFDDNVFSIFEGPKDIFFTQMIFNSYPKNRGNLREYHGNPCRFMVKSVLQHDRKELEYLNDKMRENKHRDLHKAFKKTLKTKEVFRKRSFTIG